VLVVLTRVLGLQVTELLVVTVTSLVQRLSKVAAAVLHLTIPVD
jgi:hypothetical protein